MFEDEHEQPPGEKHLDPKDRAREKAVELCMYAELSAVFEGPRKFDAGIYPSLDPNIAREVQRTMAKLAKSKTPESPILPEQSATDAASLLNFPATRDLSNNDYHIYRRPGETMILRWLAGEQVETFYDRLQAHFDAALEGLKEDERQANEWKKDAATLAYLEALDKVEIRMADRYLREPIRQHKLFILSDQTADEMNIAYLCDYIMGVPASEIVAPASAPPEEPTDRDLAWFFKLFSLRGMDGDIERMCFFTFLQKSDDEF
jgi:hypothetical protein